jgi:hypothetical protein
MRVCECPGKHDSDDRDDNAANPHTPQYYLTKCVARLLEIGDLGTDTEFSKSRA